ncbi:preprotein translocase subunit SecF [Nocardioides luteus]|uniref:Protein-export membrane protein SecF n=1 Tax=Nocardioides luteus TaxID=1844 RepID=A0ABQ5SYR5_9ACTN|nr:protein translocase subunit SecF [Nocardioides luteus]MDR7310893.1 preprotein translocase subunit SecF [Nocardioides luteus]GGR39926.1 protein translocase subunit SecF [Nocardioides luteus]GLJ69327.1 protein translocase subunit SecF [Nocardioides luteus]
MSKFSISRLGKELYTGEKSFDFVGRRMLWYAISAVVLVAVILGVSLQGLNLGIDFTGGTRYTVTVAQADQELADDLRTAVGDTAVEAADGATVRTAGGQSIVIETKAIADNSEADDAIMEAITSTADVADDDVSRTGIGPSWGERVASKAGLALGIFLIGVILFIWVYFREWKMSVAGVAALLHDVVITVGVYAIVGFEVTPATITGFLTILGYSLYDTVVVFDKVKENTRNLSRTKQTYASAANLAVNQTLVRSVNTSIIGLLPVVAILYVSTVQLGTSSLKDISLVLFVGMAVGTYSSIFIATPLLVHLKSREKEVVDAERRAAARMKEADKYAAVPVFDEGMAVADGEPDELREGSEDLHEAGVSRSPRPNTAPTGRGRNAPSQHREVSDSRAAGRPQPKRESRSKRK